MLKKSIINRNLILIILMSLLSNTNNIQASVNDLERYKDKIFTGVKTTKNVKYAQNINLYGKMQELMLDIYEPDGDKHNNRPLIIFMHGGGFMNGSRLDGYAVEFCRDFAKRGYVTVSMSYRLGVSDYFSPVAYAEAIYRAVQDAKAAVRFFRANAVTHKIDTSKIFIGGGSAGAITALHAAYWQQYLVPSYIDTKKLGNLEDTGGNEGHSSYIHGVINCWGAMIDTSLITSVCAPVVSIHGENDPVVPYKTATLGQFSLYGSYYIHEKAKIAGIKSELKAFPNTGHGLSRSDTGKWNTTLNVINNFLYSLVKQDNFNGLYERKAKLGKMEVQ